MILDKNQKQIDSFIQKLRDFTLSQSSNSDLIASIENSKKAFKMKETYQNDINLNHFIQDEGKKSEVFGNLLIDLSQYDQRLRTKELALCIARCWFIIRKHFELQDDKFTHTSINNDKQYDNIYIGDEQSMKTPMIIIIAFMISLAYSRVAIMLVRNHGGINQIFKCMNYKFEMKGSQELKRTSREVKRRAILTGRRKRMGSGTGKHFEASL